MIKVLIVDGDLFDDSSQSICYHFPDIETALPHVKEAAKQGCWACVSEEDDEG